MCRGRFLLGLLLFVIFYVFISPGKTNRSIENLDIPAALGIDIEQPLGKPALMESAVPVYIYGPQGEIFTMMRDSIGINLTELREGRQVQSNRVMMVGLEKAIIIGEAMAVYGIDNTLDFFMTNPSINDTGQTAVCKGRPEDILNLKMEGFSSSADYIEQMIKNSAYFNFFSDDYQLMDLYVRVGSEGRNLVLPYIEIRNNMPRITGIAVFSGSKMVRKLDMDEARIMNILREDKSRGILYIAKSVKENTDIYVKAKRKVDCIKKNGRYSFTINLDIKGDLVTNSLFDKLDEDPDVIKEFQTKLEKKLKSECMGFIEKMQNEYKVDCLELSRVAAAKFGRDKGVDWNDIISNSKIKVDVKIKIDKFGRGKY